MTAGSVARAAGAVAALVLGAVPALAASSNPYDAFDQTAFLAYLNAPDAGADLTRPPRLRISFGGRSYAVVMDTGSTGIVVSADKIPNIDRLPSLGPGRLTYSSSGRIMIGRWVMTPVTIMGRNGTSIAAAPIPVLAVDRVECMDNARRCAPRADPRGISMLGIGFARRGDHQAQSGPAKNPFLHVATVNGAKAQRLRTGYLVTRSGVFVGLTAANTQGGFAYVKLARAEDDWEATPVCISVNAVTPAACGTLLMDTGVTAMYLTVPDSQAPDAILTSTGRSPTLVDGTKLHDFDSDRSCAPGALWHHGRRCQKSAGAGTTYSRQSVEAAVRQYQRPLPQRFRLSLRRRWRVRRLPLDQAMPRRRSARSYHRQRARRIDATQAHVSA